MSGRRGTVHDWERHPLRPAMRCTRCQKTWEPHQERPTSPCPGKKWKS